MEDNIKKAIDHPAHYNRGKIEVIDVIDDWGLDFCLGNAVKYIGRCGAKDDLVQELEKAIWYINHEIELLKKKKRTLRS